MERAASEIIDSGAFRMRGRDVLRVEALSDVVFGFALTLLVVSLEVPRTFDQMIDAMRAFPSFAITFLLLIMVWRTHYYFFRRYGMHDARTITLNTMLLFVILFYVYPLKFLFTLAIGSLTGIPLAVRETGGAIVPAIKHAQVPELMAVFGAGFAAVYAVFTLMYLNAYRMRAALNLNAVEVFDTRVEIAHHMMLALTGIVAVAIALAVPVRDAGYAGWCYATIPISINLMRRVTARRRRKIAAALAPAENQASARN
jgi:Endosomal/lysosomal potassium channel TMEM175